MDTTSKGNGKKSLNNKLANFRNKAAAKLMNMTYKLKGAYNSTIYKGGKKTRKVRKGTRKMRGGEGFFNRIGRKITNKGKGAIQSFKNSYQNYKKIGINMNFIKKKYQSNKRQLGDKYSLYRELADKAGYKNKPLEEVELLLAEIKGDKSGLNYLTEKSVKNEENTIGLNEDTLKKVLDYSIGQDKIYTIGMLRSYLRDQALSRGKPFKTADEAKKAVNAYKPSGSSGSSTSGLIWHATEGLRG